MKMLKHGVAVFLALVMLLVCTSVQINADDSPCKIHDYSRRICKEKYLAVPEDGVNPARYYYCCTKCKKMCARTFAAERILFIGNSKTVTHGSPAYTFKKLAQYNNKGVEVSISAIPSYTLEQLLAESKSYSLIADKAYDKVIIQENSAHMWNTKFDTGIFSAYKKICNLVIKNNPNVKIYTRCPFLGKKVTRAELKGKKKYEYFTYINEETKTKLKKDTIYYFGTHKGKRQFYSYKEGRDNSVWRTKICHNLINPANRGQIIYDSDIMYEYSNIAHKDDVWEYDNFHQNDKGACILACSFYRVVYGENPKMSRKCFTHGAVKSLTKPYKYASSINNYWNFKSKITFKKFRKNTINLLNRVYGKVNG